MATELEEAIARAQVAVQSMTDFRPDREAVRRLIWCAEGRAKQEAELRAALDGERRARAKERAALRDRFAMAALQGPYATWPMSESTAERAYEYADAMLAARTKAPT